jgi:hypothetical protein
VHEGHERFRYLSFSFVLFVTFVLNDCFYFVAVHEHDHGFMHYQCLSISSMQNSRADSTSGAATSARSS